MTPKEILQKIIDCNGSCEWINRVDSTYPFEDICAVCPIRTMLPKDNTYCNLEDRTCVMSTGSVEDSDYLELALKLLLDHEIEDKLKEQDAVKGA